MPLNNARVNFLSQINLLFYAVNLIYFFRFINIFFINCFPKHDIVKQFFVVSSTIIAGF